MDHSWGASGSWHHPFVLEMTRQLERAIEIGGFSNAAHLHFISSGANSISSNLSSDVLTKALHLAALARRRHPNNAVVDVDGEEDEGVLGRNDIVIRTLRFRGFRFESIPEHRLGQAFGNTLIRVDIASNATFTDTGLRSLLAELPRLRCLRIIDCPRVTNMHPFVEQNLLRLNHLVVSRCNIGEGERLMGWGDVMQSLGNSVGPLTHLDLSGNKIKTLPDTIQQLGHMEELLLADNLIEQLPEGMFESLQELRCLVLAKNPLRSLPPTIGRLHERCHVLVAGTSTLTKPPSRYLGSIKAMRLYFTLERVKAWAGIARLCVLLRRARLRAINRLYQPGGPGYNKCKESFNKSANSQGGEDMSVTHSGSHKRRRV